MSTTVQCGGSSELIEPHEAASAIEACVTEGIRCSQLFGDV